MTWRTSSFSGAGNDCVEVAHDRFFRSSLVRDTKHRAGVPLLLRDEAWRGLLHVARETH